MGCGGMTYLYRLLEDRLRVPVIEAGCRSNQACGGNGCNGPSDVESGKPRLSSAQNLPGQSRWLLSCVRRPARCAKRWGLFVRPIDASTKSSLEPRWPIAPLLADSYDVTVKETCGLLLRTRFIANVRALDQLTGIKAMFVLYALLGLLGGFLYGHIPQRRPPSDSGSASAFGPRRNIVFKLAALFSLDAFAGGFVVQSLSLWLFENSTCRSRKRAFSSSGPV